MGRILELLRMALGECRANVEGLNLFFGAVLGVAMATTDRLSTVDFAITLAMTAAMVVSLLYVSSSPHRAFYAALAVVLVLLLPRMLGRLLDDPNGVLPHLQPTLLVWLGYIILVEIAPRRRDGEGTPMVPTAD